MNILLIFHIICFGVTFVQTSKENSDECGFVQELSRATLHPSNKIFIYSGQFFYLVDLEKEELQGKYSMDEYYEGVPTDMEGATLHNPMDRTPVMLFVKQNVIYIYEYKEHAFKESESVLDNMSSRKDLSIMTTKVSALKKTLHKGQAYNAQAAIPDKRLSMCMEREFYNCGAILTDTNPVHNCSLNKKMDKTFAETCIGLAIAELEGSPYLAYVNDKDIILFSMDDNGELISTVILPKSHKYISLSKLFSCSSWLMITVPVLVVAIVIVVTLNVVAIAVFVMRRKGKEDIPIETEASDGGTTTKVNN